MSQHKEKQKRKFIQLYNHFRKITNTEKTHISIQQRISTSQAKKIESLAHYARASDILRATVSATATRLVKIEHQKWRWRWRTGSQMPLVDDQVYGALLRQLLRGQSGLQVHTMQLKSVQELRARNSRRSEGTGWREQAGTRAREHQTAAERHSVPAQLHSAQFCRYLLL